MESMAVLLEAGGGAPFDLESMTVLLEHWMGGVRPVQVWLVCL